MCFFSAACWFVSLCMCLLWPCVLWAHIWIELIFLELHDSLWLSSHSTRIGTCLRIITATCTSLCTVWTIVIWDQWKACLTRLFPGAIYVQVSTECHHLEQEADWLDRLAGWLAACPAAVVLCFAEQHCTILHPQPEKTEHVSPIPSLLLSISSPFLFPHCGNSINQTGTKGDRDSILFFLLY